MRKKKNGGGGVEPAGSTYGTGVHSRISPEQLFEILEIAEDGIVTIDASQRIVLFNRGASKLFGFNAEEVIGQPLDVLLPERYLVLHREQVVEFSRSAQSARLMGERNHVCGRRKDGSEFPAEVSISKFESEGTLLLTAIVRDVSERTRYEQAERELEQFRARAELANTQAKFDAVIQSAHDAIIILDSRQTVTLFNPAAETVFGCPAASAIGSALTRYLPGGLPPAEPGRLAPREVEGRRGDGRTVPLEVSSSHTEIAGQTVHTLILRDITGRRETEREIATAARQREQALAQLQTKTEELRATTQQLWQAAKLAGVGELAASIAHELNNPLGTVSLRIERLLARTPATDPHHQSLAIVEGEVGRMARLVANLLQFSRAGREQVSTVDICSEIMSTLDLVAHHLHKRRVRVETQFAPNVPAIHADRQQLRQVFLNLFTNAADAMPDGGKLIPRVAAGTLGNGKTAIIVEVIDTGVGIAIEHRARVSEPFFTTKEEGKGTGLGLAICRRIVQQHQGTLEIESEAGCGTTVRITLPTRQDTNVARLHANP